MTADDKRPLSPHLQIYKPQLTTVLSILHRATGVGLSVASLLLVYWLIALARGPRPYAEATALLGSLPARLVLAAVSFSFFYHLCNGLRHLAWDAGYGFEIRRTYASGWAVVAVSIALTAAFWMALSGGGS